MINSFGNEEYDIKIVCSNCKYKDTFKQKVGKLITKEDLKNLECDICKCKEVFNREE